MEIPKFYHSACLFSLEAELPELQEMFGEVGGVEVLRSRVIGERQE